MKVLFAGGGTMGSVTPLIAVAEVLKSRNPGADLYWLGTKTGPEEKVVRHYNINFKSITAGRLRRYFSWQNFLDFFRVIFGFIETLFILMKIRPGVIVSAGGFVAVPVVWAGWLLNIPSVIHQQDVKVGLANRLCVGAAKKITVCFPETAKKFPQRKTEVIGNPVGNNLRAAEKIEQAKWRIKLGLKDDWPIVVVTTGGTGALGVNELVMDALKGLTKFCQVIHITGQHKAEDNFEHENYIQYEFLVNITPLIAMADVVVIRAGMATLTEVSYLAKPVIIIPIPNSHQEQNASYFYERGAAEVLQGEELDSDDLIKKIKGLIDNKNRLKELSNKIHRVMKWGAEERLGEIIEEINK